MRSVTRVHDVFVPELPKTHLSGITRWLSKDRALIQLGLRHKTSDHAWFSFFHEAGHLLLHGKKTIFIDEKRSDRNEIESEADRFAGDWLLAPDAFRRIERGRAAFVRSWTRSSR